MRLDGRLAAGFDTPAELATPSPTLPTAVATSPATSAPRARGLGLVRLGLVRSTSGRPRASGPRLVWIAGVSSALIGVVLVLHFAKGIPIHRMTRDPNTIANFPHFTGFLSQAGILLWSAAATVCLFSARVVARVPARIELRRFLVASGLLTILLGLDDAFLLHEKLYPRLGIHERATVGIYAGLLLFLLARYRKIVLDSEFFLLGIALAFFGLSVLVDGAVPLAHTPTLHLIEDGAKLVGIVSWLSYFQSVGLAAARDTTPPASSRRDDGSDPVTHGGIASSSP